MKCLNNLIRSVIMIFHGVIGLITFGLVDPGTRIHDKKNKVVLSEEEIDWINAEYPVCNFYTGKRE